jgi:hypothetical protein
MKLQISAGLLLAATFALALGDVQPSEGQEAAEPATTQAATTTYTPAAVAPVQLAEPSKNIKYFFSTKSNPEFRQAERTLRQAAAALRDAKDDVAKADAKTQLTNLLNNYFEEDMRRREEELAKIEARLKDLREQAARRREKKSEIVDLQIKVLLNEVEGLGFFSEAASTGLPLIPVEQAFQRRTWNSNTPYAPIPTRTTGAAPPTTESAESNNPFGAQPSPK